MDRKQWGQFAPKKGGQFGPKKWGQLRRNFHTGRRREEIINLKFNQEYQKHGCSFLKVEDYKVNRIGNRTKEEQKKYVSIPVTPGLQQVLDELGYEKYKGTDNFVLAPELQINRKRVMADSISRGFAHFYQQVEPEGKLTFKSLRKTYITGLSRYFSSDVKAVSQHSSQGVIDEHYKDMEMLLQTAMNYHPFGETENREGQLEELRNKTNEIKSEKGLEK